MPNIFEKLNLKSHREILALNVPSSFEPELAALSEVNVLREASGNEAVQFVLAFVSKQAEVDRLSPLLSARLEGDGLIWFAYPKGSSKKYSSELNRDHGWDVLRQHGFDTVRQVAIDEDWSALRFRRVEFIKAGKTAHSQ
jgi:hypothetical protein